MRRRAPGVARQSLPHAFRDARPPDHERTAANDHTRRAGLVTVRNDGVARRLPQRIEPGMLVPPLGESLAEERLAHLFRAGGVYRAPAAVERQTSRVEFESAMRKDLAHAGAEVLDQVLVADPKHPSRQDPIPMTHQLQIRPVISCDLL